MDLRETAEALGISEGAVKVRLHRARALLQRELAPKLKGFAPKRARAVWVGRMRIDCKHVWEHISAYIDGEVDEELRAEIDRIWRRARSARRCWIRRATWSC